MKTTVVPAQITTVEDKIAGNLSFNQLLLLTTPVFLTGAIFAFLPPFMNFRGYKLSFCLVLSVVCMTLAIRLKGKILLQWLVVIARYNARARYFIYNKNDMYLRGELLAEPAITAEPAKQKEYSFKSSNRLPIALPDMVRMETAVSDPRANFHFRVAKRGGGLRVYIKEVK